MFTNETFRSTLIDDASERFVLARIILFINRAAGLPGLRWWRSYCPNNWVKVVRFFWSGSYKFHAYFSFVADGVND